MRAGRRALTTGRSRAGALTMGLSVALLAGCSSGGTSTTDSTTVSPATTTTTTAPEATGSATTATTAPAASTTASPSATATAAVATTRILMTPASTAGWTVTAGGQISCGSEPSRAGATTNTYTCGSTADAAVACVVDTDGTHLLCLNDPWRKKATRFTLTSAAPPSPKPANPLPLGIELADGSRWFMRAGGAWSSGPKDAIPMYGCTSGCAQNEALFMPDGSSPDDVILKEGDTWSARRGPMGPGIPANATLTRVPITKAYVLRAAPTSTTAAGGAGGTGALGPMTSPMIAIAAPTDARKLPNTNGLRAFARSQLAAALKDNPGCPMTITVEKLDAKSSAMVSEFGSGCGGGMAIWGVKAGRWVKVYGGQEAPTCAALRRSGATLNPDVIGTCLGPAPSRAPMRYTP